MLKLVQSHKPIGTLEEIEAAGYRRDACASCSDSDVAGNRGCPRWANCIFTSDAYGKFKGQGPRNIGYHIRTPEGDSKEDFMPCYQFMGTLFERMRVGQSNMMLGKKFELIKIVAQEGQEYVDREITPEDPNNNRTGNGRMVQKVRRVKVPAFKRPNERDADAVYSSQLEQMERERLLALHGGATLPETREEMMAAAEQAVAPVADGVELAKPIQTLRGKGK